MSAGGNGADIFRFNVYFLDEAHSLMPRPPSSSRVPPCSGPPVGKRAARRVSRALVVQGEARALPWRTDVN